ncbi:MAG TPA: hypothetical protein VFF31_22150 [Blastocatellia bacterium]|nr:hypothetical protein [Blastocatellia bacterium]
MTTHSKILSCSATTRVIFAAAASIIFVALTTSVAEMQAKQPYDRDKLLRVVQLNALPTSEVVQAIQQRGVDFRMTTDIESQFRGAGARPEVIDAIRGNYRGATSQPANNQPSNPPNNPSGNSRPTSSVPSGPPLAKNEIITLLQSGVPTSRVEQFVEVRGVSFSINPQIAREIKDAGGNNALIGAITAKASEAPPSSSGPSVNRPSQPAGPDYDDLTDKAVAAMQANNTYGAIRLLQQAVTLDSAKPQAYGLLGFAQLYGSKDIIAAERSMRAAIERGGGAPFRVYHDHDKFFNTFCQGSLFVSRTNVTFRADDGNHTFEARRPDIKEAKINGFVGAQYGAYHLKVGAGKGETYNFAPFNRQKSEANLVLSLINSYQ